MEPIQQQIPLIPDTTTAAELEAPAPGITHSSPTVAATTTQPPPAIAYIAPERCTSMSVAYETERPFYVAWSRIRGIGPAKFERILSIFGSAEAAWTANDLQLRQVGLDDALRESVLRQRLAIDPDREYERLDKLVVTALMPSDAQYPTLLRKIPNAPFVLYVRGTLLPADEASVAIVGTRKVSTYGRQVTARLTRELVEQGLTIISGLAHGVDAIAHVTALDAGGRTIAVLGCGVDIVYPPDHNKLAARIIEQGAIISDFPLGVQPESAHFPARNRIISGIAGAVLVTEAPEKSGALITANIANEQHGREVMAVPGNIYSNTSKGCNRLIQDGAHCVTSAKDVIEQLNVYLLPQQLIMREVLPANETEAIVLKFLRETNGHVDDLSRELAMPASEISSVLMMMEIKGLVKNLGSMTYGIA